MINSIPNNNTALILFEIKEDKIQISSDKKIKESNFKIHYPKQTIKTFDNTVKNNILELNGLNNKIRFPKDDKQDLAINLQFLVLQIFIMPGVNWTLEITLTDTNKTKRRIIISSATKSIEKKPFYMKFPSDSIKKQTWLNLCLDLFSFNEGFKNCNIKSFDELQIGSICKLRRVLMLKSLSQDDRKSLVDIPKAFNQWGTISYETQLINYQQLIKD